MDKLKLLETTFRKLSADPNFMAYYLVKAGRRQHKTEIGLMEMLHCDAAHFYKLGLCQAPDPERSDFTERLGRIAGYAGVSLIALSGLLKPEMQTEQQIAVSLFPEWLRQARPVRALQRAIAPFTLPAVFYRGGLSFVCLLFFAGVITAKVDTSLPALYGDHLFAYKDSIKKVCLQDHTQVQQLF